MKPNEFIKKRMEELNKATSYNEYLPLLAKFEADLDARFIDKEKIIDINAGTCLGLEIFKIQKIIDFFRKEDFNPYEWEEFELELARRRFV